MAQTYQKSHHDYEHHRKERRPSHGPLLTVDRALPYVAYTGRTDSRSYVLPTPIHDIDQDDDQNSSRKRTSVACGRCRRRKIKCSGGTPCQACRSAGVDPGSCLYTRVGTNQTFNLDTSVGGPAPMTPMSSYSPVSPGGAYPAYPADERTPTISTYGRSGYHATPLPAYSSYDSLETPTYPVGESSRSWTNGHRPSTGVSYYGADTPIAYDYPTPASRASITESEPLSPLNMSNLQSSLPHPIERRLPAPNLVGSPMTPDAHIISPISARLSNLSIGGPYGRNNSATWAVDSGERRQPSIHDLAEASMMLPPVTRGLNPAAAILPAPSQETVSIPTLYSSASSSEDITSTTQPTYYAANPGALPSLTSGMLPPTNYGRYSGVSAASSLPVIDTTTRATDNYYGWTPANVVSTTTDTTAIEAVPSSAHRSSSTNPQTRYPPLHHPRPKVVPSSSHAATLEKHDHVQQREDHRKSSSSGSGKSASSSHSLGTSSSHGKKASHKPSKGSSL